MNKLQRLLRGIAEAMSLVGSRLLIDRHIRQIGETGIVGRGVDVIGLPDGQCLLGRAGPIAT